MVEQSFFTHASLLEPGLSDWSAEAGALRSNLGTANADYGSPFAGGLWRYGVTDRLTLEAQALWNRSLRSGGLGITFALPWQALGQAGVRLSNTRAQGHGHEWLLAMEGERRGGGFESERALHSSKLRCEPDGERPADGRKLDHLLRLAPL